MIASFVPGEWLTHAGPEADKLRLALKQVDEDAGRFHDFCVIAGITPPFSRPGYRLLPLADALHDLSCRLRDSAMRLEPDEVWPI